MSEPSLNFWSIPIEIWKYIIVPIFAAVIAFLGTLLARYIDAKVKEQNNHSLKKQEVTQLKEVYTQPTLTYFKNKSSLTDIDQNEKLQRVIEEILSSLRQSLMVDRTWIMKFHNGIQDDYYPSLNEWQLISIVGDSTKSGISHIKHKFHHIPVILYKPFLTDIMTKGYFIVNDISKLDSTHKSLFELEGIISSCGVGIFDESGKLRGIIGYDNIFTQFMNPDAETFKKLTAYGKLIIDYLSMYKIKK